MGKCDEWYTPKYVFDALGCQFDMDVASPVDRQFTHVPAHKFITHDSLTQPWDGFIWMNPPFGNGDKAKMLWMDKFIAHGNGIALTPDRTSTDWFAQCAKRCDGALFVTGKIKFIMQDGKIGEQPGNGTVLWSMGEMATDALYMGKVRGLGFMANFA